MIVREIGGEFWLFDQRDHSALCGRMAELWGAAPFQPVPAAVQRAADIHDGGWPEWDRQPRLDLETGKPHPYSRMPEVDYYDIWERGLARGWAEGATAGLLVSLHAMRFFGHRTRPEDRAMYADQRRRQADALRRLGAASDDVEALPEPYASWHAWMFFWDALSLFLCEGWESPWTKRIPAEDGGEAEVRVERQDDAITGGIVTVSPFPFQHPFSLAVSARVIPSRRYAAQQELDDAVNRAPRREMRWSLQGPA
jgi:hypothetical protein